MPSDMGKGTGQQSTAAPGTGRGVGSSAHEAANKKGGARQLVQAEEKSSEKNSCQEMELGEINCSQQQQGAAATFQGKCLGSSQGKCPVNGEKEQQRPGTSSWRKQLQSILQSEKGTGMGKNNVGTQQFCAEGNAQASEAVWSSNIVGGPTPRAEGNKMGKRMIMRGGKEKLTEIFGNNKLIDEVQTIIANDKANGPRILEVNMRDLFEETEKWKKVVDDYLNKFLDEKRRTDSEMVNSIPLELPVQRLSERLEGMHEIHDDLAEEHKTKLSELKKLRDTSA
ncbi:hypothetical protein FRX31_025035 [Thalictrum thalictroides]|uniref:Uncharacterized protein n=1 Tax=Thalictrum thalictroides TaxID=46969 RepID=A0A7J6VKV1_THATH|nr:hypothetical protein FRX31_025035 [Thalictrum thalictroides]